MNKKVLEHKCDTILGCNCNIEAALKDIVEITFHKKSTYFFQIFCKDSARSAIHLNYLGGLFI